MVEALLACRPHQSDGSGDSTREPYDGPMPKPDNRSVVQQFYDQWNSGAIDFDRLVREDFTNHQRVP